MMCVSQFKPADNRPCDDAVTFDLTRISFHKCAIASVRFSVYQRDIARILYRIWVTKHPFLRLFCLVLELLSRCFCFHTDRDAIIKKYSWFYLSQTLKSSFIFILLVWKFWIIFMFKWYVCLLFIYLWGFFPHCSFYLSFLNTSQSGIF